MAKTNTLDTARALAERRYALSISQRVLAELVRCGRVSLARYERGADAIPPKRAKQIDAALTVLEAGYRVAAEVAREAASE